MHVNNHQKAPQKAPGPLLPEEAKAEEGQFMAPPPFMLMASHDDERGPGFGGPVMQQQAGPTTVDLINYDALADRLADATGVSSDRETPNSAEIYTILYQMDGKPERMQALRKTFKERFDQNLDELISLEGGGSYLSTVNDAIKTPKEDQNSYTKAKAIAKELKAALENDDTHGMVKLLMPLKLNEKELNKVFRSYRRLVRGRGDQLYKDIFNKYKEDPIKRNLLEQLLGYRQEKNEQVDANNPEEAAEAQRIVEDIYEKYGVELNSNLSLSNEQKSLDKISPERLKEMKTSKWNLDQLKALQSSLKLYEHHDHEHEAGLGLDTVGRIENTFAENKVGAPMNTASGAATIRSEKSMNLYDPIEVNQDTSNWIFQPGKEDAERLFTHELAHAHFGNLIEEFMEQFPYWQMPYRSNGEAPISNYGDQHPDEDLAESFLYYLRKRNLFENGQTFRNKQGVEQPIPLGSPGNACPDRLAWVEEILERYKNEESTGGRRNSTNQDPEEAPSPEEEKLNQPEDDFFPPEEEQPSSEDDFFPPEEEEQQSSEDDFFPPEEEEQQSGDDDFFPPEEEEHQSGDDDFFPDEEKEDQR